MRTGTFSKNSVRDRIGVSPVNRQAPRGPQVANPVGPRRSAGDGEAAGGPTAAAEGWTTA